MIKDIILGWLECFGKKYFVVGYVLEAPQNNSEKLFWGVTLVILPRVARMVLAGFSEATFSVIISSHCAITTASSESTT